MSRLIVPAICCATFAQFAFATTIVFETDQNVKIVRTVDFFGSAMTEFLGEAGQAYQCIALDSAGEPLAVSPALADVGSVTFQDIPVEAVSSIACRKI